MLVETLRKQRDARGAQALHCVTTFEGGDLILGAGTKLAAVELDSPPEDGDASAANDARIVALLSARAPAPADPTIIGSRIPPLTEVY